MKRLIKYRGGYSNNADFSDCSTEFEVLPELIDDKDATLETLVSLALKHNIEIQDQLVNTENFPRWNRLHGMPVVLTTERYEDTSGFRNESKTIPIYLGMITVPTGKYDPLEPVAKYGLSITESQRCEIVNMQSYGVENCGEMIDGNSVLIADHWALPVNLKLLGYDPESFYDSFDETGFSDDTFSCDECGKYDNRDDGYTYNHRIVDECTQLGINCGCYDEYMQSEDALSEFVNNHDRCVESTVADHHEEAGRLKKLQTYIGGMVDGRGGYINGESVPEGTPESILKELLAKHPNKKYIFVHEESGQFQTYFSVYEVSDE